MSAKENTNYRMGTLLHLELHDMLIGPTWQCSVTVARHSCTTQQSLKPTRYLNKESVLKVPCCKTETPSTRIHLASSVRKEIRHRHVAQGRCPSQTKNNVDLPIDAACSVIHLDTHVSFNIGAQRHNGRRIPLTCDLWGQWHATNSLRHRHIDDLFADVLCKGN